MLVAINRMKNIEILYKSYNIITKLKKTFYQFSFKC